MKPRTSILPGLMLFLSVPSLIALASIAPAFATNQLAFFAITFLAFFGISSIRFSWLQRLRWIAYLGVILLLLSTLILGSATKGATAWLSIGSYKLQASELLKPVLFLVLATSVAQKPLRSVRRLIEFVLLAGVPIVLVLAQPDFGTAVILMAGTGIIFLLSRPRWRYVVALAAGGGAVAIAAWFFLLAPYQKDRIRTFLSPTSDPFGSGYNARQAMVSVGAGGWLGRGFGNGLQSTLQFLPERQTDFLFATFAEQAGFVGTSGLLMLYTALFWWLGRTLKKCESNNTEILVSVYILTLLFQSAINIGMNLGLTPITGVPLPLFSLGGSSLLATGIELGIIESVRRRLC